MIGKELIEEYKNPEQVWNNINFGKWYHSTYSIYNTFTENELLNMSKKEINNLIRLANNLSKELY